MQLMHIRSLEGDSSTEHSKEKHTQAPNINKEAFISIIRYNLRSYISRSATLLINNSSSSNDLRDSKIADLNHIIGVDENIIEFDISMKYRARMNVSETVDYLLENELSNRLTQSSFLLHIL